MKKKILVVLVAAVFLLSGCVEPAEEEQPLPSGPGSLEKIPNPDRSSYGTGLFVDSQGKAVEKPVEEAFVDLPLMPEDFGETIHLMQEGNFDAVAKGLGEEYFKQPEFLPKFEEIGLNYWTKHDTTRWGREGFGIYPSDQTAVVSIGEEIELVAFVHTAYGVETFQGLSLYSFFPEEENAAGIFSVKIEQENILLGPSYPIMDGNWMQKIVIKIKAKENAIPGDYLIGFNAGSPEQDLSKEWAEKFGPKYVSGKGLFSIDRLRLKAIITVK